MRVMWLSMNSSMLHGDEALGLTAPLERALADHFADQINLAVVFASEYEGQAKTVRGMATYYPINADVNEVIFSYQGWERTKAELLRVIEDFRPDIIQCFGSEWSYGAIAECVSMPVVIHMMGFLNAYFPALDMVRGYCAIPADSHGKTPEHRPEDVAAAFERWRMRANHYFMGRTEWDKNIVKYYSPGSIYFHVPEAIKPSIYRASGQWKYHGNGKLRLLTISSADDRKGNEIILRTAQMLKELLRIDFEWRVAGSREFFPYFERRTGIQHQDVNVSLLGPIDTSRIIEELSSADFFIHPSIIDNSANAICEAQLIGCPVIASNVGGTAQLVEDGVTGFLYPYNEPHTLAFLIGNLYREEGVLTRISQNEAEMAHRRHDPKLVAEAVLHTYASVIKDWESRPRVEPSPLDQAFPAAVAATAEALDRRRRFPPFALFVKGLRCLKNHGIRYTWRKAWDKLRR